MNRKKRGQRRSSEATPKKKRRSNSHKNNDNNNNNYLPGFVERMILKNFMCHSYLEVRFSKNVTFITGRNGSGKSAILTALVVGLAGRASLTQRGNSVRNFIKTGQQSGSVEITMRNTGILAYRPEDYGDKITVVRMFGAGGAGGYKIKSATGQVISQSAREVQNVLLALNIQTDNPICVLNQDTARNFLLSNNPNEKYTLYRKATGLENLLEEYTKLQDTFADFVIIITQKTKSLEKLEQEMKLYQKKVENCEKYTELQNNYKQLATEVLWAKVQEHEGQLNEQKRVMTELQNIVLKYEEMINNESQLEQDLKSKIIQLEQQIAEINQTTNLQLQPIQEIDKKVEKYKETIRDNRLKMEELTDAINQRNRKIQSVQEEITNFAENFAKKQREQLEREQRRTKYTEEIKSVQDVLETTKNDMFQLKHSISTLEQERNDFEKERRTLQQQISAAAEYLVNMKKESSNLYVYGQEIPRVIEAIKAAQHKFSKPPKGPLGSYVKIKDKKWLVAIEGFIGPSLLRSFVVDNATDGRLLRAIFQDNFRSDRHLPSILTTKFLDKTHDVSAHKVVAPPDCLALYDAVRVEDPVVLNCLVDQLGLEKVLLLSSDERSLELMSRAENVPPNCSRGISAKGDSYYPAPSYRTYCSTYRQARFLETDKVELVRYNQQKIEETKGKLASVQNQYQTVMTNKKCQESKLQEITSKENILSKKYMTLKKDLYELGRTKELEMTNCEPLEISLKSLKDEIQVKSLKLEELNGNTKTFLTDIECLNAKKKDLAANMKSIRSRTETLMTQVAECNNQQREINIKKTFDEKRLLDARNNVQVNQEKFKSVEAELLHQLNLAGGEENRIATTRQSKVINNELKKIERKLQEMRSNGDDFDEIMTKYQEICERYSKAMKRISLIIDQKHEMTCQLQKRSMEYINSADYIGHYVNYNFQQILKHRNFSGHIDIDTEQKTLELVVMPQHGSQECASASSNLSGGERSFSTVAFLYSLWQVLQYPFYFLDEFDVFMDKVNRSKVIEMLIYHAKQRPNMQFVFLTPQDISFIQDDDTAIHKLADPKRGKDDM